MVEEILRDNLDDTTEVRWPEGPKNYTRGLRVLELPDGVEDGTYTDESRVDNITGAATITRGEYEGSTIFNSNQLGVDRRKSSKGS